MYRAVVDCNPINLHHCDVEGGVNGYDDRKFYCPQVLHTDTYKI